MKKAEKFRAESVRAREDYAAGLLDAGNILAEAAKRAAQGEQEHAVMLERPVDVSQTAAAKLLEATLTEHGFKMEWQKRAVMAGGIEKTAWTLIVRW